MTTAQLDRSTSLHSATVLVVDDHRTFAELLSGALVAAGGTAWRAGRGLPPADLPYLTETAMGYTESSDATGGAPENQGLWS